jgi:hypothetical protein
MEVIIAILVGAVIGVAAFYLFNLAQETVTRKAKVVGKRTETRVSADSSQQEHSSIHSTTYYYCTFEFKDGQRKEYVVGQRRYGVISEGDHGELDTKGVLFWDFRRASGRLVPTAPSEDNGGKTFGEAITGVRAFEP